ncbi:MAG: hypothetical protein M3463_15950 [Verrucomicrobiota bacterium]|nr:hypothetical protein [Verrucomicrobiota bacterium]
MTLLASAKEFLVEALADYAKGKRSFAVVHAVTSAELVLKERLARIHPHLIFEKIDALNFQNERTVALRHLPQRLVNLGVVIEPREVKLIQQFADWRNQIVHHLPAFDSRTLEVQLPQLLDFLASFMRRELGTLLEEVLPKDLYRTAKDVLTEWQRVVGEAQSRANAEGQVLMEECPFCGVSHVLFLRKESDVYCHLCEVRGYWYGECEHCGRHVVSNYSDFDERMICDTCLDAYAESYAV